MYKLAARGQEYTSPMRLQKRAFVAVAALFLGALFFLSTPSETVHRFRLHKASPWKPHKRKGLVMSTGKHANVTWLENVPTDWEVYRYIVDDPTAHYHVKVNQGHEAMPYISFIVDNYDHLPDYIVFSHGHERAWHQPVPFHYYLHALNLPLLDQLGWVSLRCALQNTCEGKKNRVYPRKSATWTLSAMLIHIHEVVFQPTDAWYEPLPESFAVPCCSQFAASKAQVLKRPKAFWLRIHKVLASDLQETLAAWDIKDTNHPSWKLGGMFEFTWPFWFGMPPVVCLDTDYCWQNVFQNKIHCSGDTWDFTASQGIWEDITCTLDGGT